MFCTILGTGNTLVSKIDKNSRLRGIHALLKENSLVKHTHTHVRAHI